MSRFLPDWWNSSLLSGGRLKTESLFPDDLLAGNRLRVDVGEAGFFNGRQQRIAYELNVPVDTRRVIRVDVGVNTILTSSTIELDQGGLRYSLALGGTESGTFGDTVPVIPKNTMTDAPAYTAQNTLTTGANADVTGGTEIPAGRIRTSTSGFIRSSGVSGVEEMRGFGPQTIYLVFETLTGTNDTALGLFQLEWEERP